MKKIMFMMTYDLVGSIFIGVSIVCFAVAADFAPGGVNGIAVMATCYGTGEAAGAAAALSIKEDVPFRKLSVKKLQDQLKKQGVYLGDQEPEKPEPRYIHISTI